MEMTRTSVFMTGAMLVAVVTAVFGMGDDSRDEQTVTPPAVATEPDLAAVRKATERFQDVAVALAAGYIRDPFDLCDTAEMMGRPPELGAMGVPSDQTFLASRVRPIRG